MRAEAPGAVVGEAGHPLYLVQRAALLGGGTGNLEDREVPGAATALLDLAGGAPEMSSVTTTVRQSMPCSRSWFCPAVKSALGCQLAAGTLDTVYGGESCAA